MSSENLSLKRGRSILPVKTFTAAVMKTSRSVMNLSLQNGLDKCQEKIHCGSDMKSFKHLTVKNELPL